MKPSYQSAAHVNENKDKNAVHKQKHQTKKDNTQQDITDDKVSRLKTHIQ